MIKRIFLVNNYLKKLWIALAVLIILIAVLSSVFRSLTPWAKEYKGEVEHHLSLLLGQPVTIKTMETGWYWFEPVLKLREVVVQEGDEKSLHLEKLLVGINLFKSLWNWQIQPGVLYIDDVDLVFREVDGHWTIDGISTSNQPRSEMSADNTRKILGWLSQQEHLIIRHVSAHFHFSNGGLIPLSGLNLSVINSGGHYKLKGNAHLNQTSSSVFELLGDVVVDPSHLQRAKGQLFFSAKNLSLVQWQDVFPQIQARIEGGKGDIALWLDLQGGKLSQVQAQIKVKRLAWSLVDKKISQLIPMFDVNLDWKPDDQGWQLHADHIKLRTNGLTWPENQLAVTYNKVQNTHQLFVKTINIDSLLSSAVAWPESLQTILDQNPKGILTDTQIQIKDRQWHYLLTRFSQLGWNGRGNIPEVQNLSGVLNWQPEEGRLELDSEDVLIAAPHYPMQHLKLLNTALDWKRLSDGLRISVERFVLSKPDLTLSAEGAVDQVTANSAGHIRLNAEFSGKNIQQWGVFLPQKRMKPKLYNWLRHDLKKVTTLTGKLNVNGMAQDFPFDNNNGEFSITGHASGCDILITPKWQLIKDVDGYIRLKKRNLEIDIVNADFQGVPVKQLQLRIDDIGKDKEILLIHGMITGAGQKMMNFVFASPLKEKLRSLQMLAIKGMLDLNLRLEIPLYPENNTNLAQGNLSFKNNKILVKHQLGSLPIEDVSGGLSFNEHGVVQSSLVASSFGYPMAIKIHSEQLPQPATVIEINGKYSVESLKNRFNIPILAVLKGLCEIDAILKLTANPNNFDQLNLNSSLQGLAIALPPPLGKSYDEKVPLAVKVDFNPQKLIRLRTNYDSRISADVTFAENQGIFELSTGQVRLGSAHALDQNKPGLAIVGSLDGFDLQEWKSILTRYSNEDSNSDLFNTLRIINVTMNSLRFLDQSFDKMSIKAKLLANRDWSINLNQKKIAADLRYTQATNSLSGLVKYLHLAKFTANNSKSKTSDTVNPGQIPNLNLRIDNMIIGDINLGTMTLKSHSTPERFALDYCRIDSAVYQFNIDGEWTKKQGNNRTSMHVKLNLKDLAKGLERWNITPVVDAGKGEGEFKGYWNGSIYDFSLGSLNGSLFLQLKEGRITHLSPETEEKLGLGKLLSILSLQTIPRRLKLDFSDLSKQGYSFDIFKGNFNLNRGIMNTGDSYIDGPVAYTSMKGELDLVKRMYDLDLSISPHITASLPVVATIAGGPIAGIAAWVASKIINKGMQKIVAYTYKVSGPWSEPVVQQLTMIKKIINSEGT